MRKVFPLAAVLLCCMGAQAESTRMSVISLSVQVSPATAEDPLTDLEWNLSVSSSGNAGAPNGEMLLADEDVPYTHQGDFILTDPTTGEPIVLPFVLDVPDWVDDNENGVPEFYERDVGTDQEETQGAHPTPDGKGAEFTARWNRAAGDASGTVVLDLPYFGLKFSTDYSVPTYTGVYNFTRNETNLSGTVLLTNQLISTEVVSGVLALTISNATKIGYTEGTWKGADGANFSFFPVDTLDRIGTNFISLLGMEDGFPQTSESDYQTWFLVMHSQDSDADGVLDLTQAPAQTNAAVRMEISRSDAGVVITARGPDGPYLLEASTFSGTNAWSNVQTIQLSGGTGEARLAAEGRSQFFRLRQAPAGAVRRQLEFP